jgi:hypothetical protein
VLCVAVARRHGDSKAAAGRLTHIVRVNDLPEQAPKPYQQRHLTLTRRAYIK